MQPPHEAYILKGGDLINKYLGWGEPCLGDDLGRGGETTHDAQGCWDGPSLLELLESE